jgi:predicted hydrocarbon binding protein
MHQPSERRLLQETMGFLGALASGTEEALGARANRVSFAAGKRLGQRFSVDAKKTTDLNEALDELRRVLSDAHCLWNFESFEPSRLDLFETKTGEDGETIYLVFRECMIRQSLFLFGHEQKGSLCNLMFGFFSGALEHITGNTASLEIVHAGENACLKRLHVRRNNEPLHPRKST